MIEKTGNDLLVIASHPQELAEGQLAMIEHVKIKEAESQLELTANGELMEHCKKAKITTAPVKRLRSKIESRLKYLTKLRTALEEGFVIVPNFPGTTIAVRVKRDKPIRKTETSTYSTPGISSVAPEQLSQGEGRYVNPIPIVKTHAQNTGEKRYGSTEEIIKYSAWPVAYDEDIALPVEFLKPTVMQMTTKTMARKLFDEILIIDGNIAQRGDPMVLGRLIDKRNGKQVTFLIAWFIDSKDIV